MPAIHEQAALRVVLVEDHADFRELLTYRIHALDGARVVHSVARSHEAVEWLRAHPRDWDLIVLDIFLADGHGFQVLQACKERAARQHAVFLTSYTRDPARGQAMALGANAVFSKLEIDEFIDYVRQRRDCQHDHPEHQH